MSSCARSDSTSDASRLIGWFLRARHTERWRAQRTTRPLPDVDQPAATLTDYERHVLALWSDVHKKSTLTLFILAAVARAPGWSGDITAFLVSNSRGHLSIDEQSLYRARCRLEG